jgi:UDP-N-acetylglucosamine 4,6-dehydratase (inverting)
MKTPFWKDKTIVLTGGTGSFGRRFTEVLLRDHAPRALRIFSRDELKQLEMQKTHAGDDRLRFFVGDVRDRDRLMRAVAGADVIVHAAALKQVPACEYNPLEAVKTNILGAANIIDAAIERGVPRVLALSTDKAVNPVNLYGATKLCAEKLFVQGNSYVGPGATRFACVRYGNVVGSRGSVIPLFREQARTGEITLTDLRMTRFWITLTQGVEFVLSCTERMQGGEVFVPKIPSMRLTDLAEAIAPGSKRKVIGIRPGEKLHEALLTEDESRHALEFSDRYLIEPEHEWWQKGAGHAEATRLPDGFRYTSDNNRDWLSVAQLHDMIDR